MNSKNRNPNFSQEYYDTIQLYKKLHKGVLYPVNSIRYFCLARGHCNNIKSASGIGLMVLQKMKRVIHYFLFFLAVMLLALPPNWTYWR